MSRRRRIATSRRIQAARRHRTLSGQRRQPGGRHVSPRMLALQDLRARRTRGERTSSLARVVAVVAVFLGTMTLGFLFLGAGVTVAAWNHYSEDLPQISEVEARQFETTKIYDRNWT